jgi:hypothetical protein
MCSDLSLVHERIKDGVTTQRSNVMDKYWSRWDAFCLAHNVDPLPFDLGRSCHHAPSLW